MKKHAIAIGLVLVSLTLASEAFADRGKRGCSIDDVAGRWVFATSIGRQTFGPPFPPEGDITAIGTMNIGRDGSIEGRFDVNVEDFEFGPVLGATYFGSIHVNEDCTGNIEFATSEETSRLDSIVIVNRREILAMSLDPLNVWTYQIRRIDGLLRAGRRDD